MNQNNLSQLLEQLTEMLTASNLAAFDIDIEEDDSQPNTVLYLIINNESENPERIATVYPSMANPEDYDMDSTAELFATAPLALKAMSERISVLANESKQERSRLAMAKFIIEAAYKRYSLALDKQIFESNDDSVRKLHNMFTEIWDPVLKTLEIEPDWFNQFAKETQE